MQFSLLLYSFIGRKFLKILLIYRSKLESFDRRAVSPVQICGLIIVRIISHMVHHMIQVIIFFKIISLQISKKFIISEVAEIEHQQREDERFETLAEANASGTVTRRRTLNSNYSCINFIALDSFSSYLEVKLRSSYDIVIFKTELTESILMLLVQFCSIIFYL